MKTEYKIGDLVNIISEQKTGMVYDCKKRRLLNIYKVLWLTGVTKGFNYKVFYEKDLQKIKTKRDKKINLILTLECKVVTCLFTQYRNIIRLKVSQKADKKIFNYAEKQGIKLTGYGEYTLIHSRVFKKYFIVEDFKGERKNK